MRIFQNKRGTLSCRVFIFLAILNPLVFADFTFGVIPDTQHYSQTDQGLALWNAEMQWFVAQKDALNIVFVSHLGDMTNDWATAGEWTRAKQAMNILKTGGLRYSVCQGNHDDITSLRGQFPVSDWQGKAWFGGYFGGMENAYYLFSEAGMDFIIVVIQTHDQFIGTYDQASITWANNLFNQYSNRRAIFVTHDFYEKKNLITDVVKKHDNIFLAVCGHSCGREANWTETSPSGNTINCIMTDYQCDAPETGILRYYTFKPASNQICAYTYSAGNKAYETDANSQFTFTYKMATTGAMTPTAKSSDTRENEFSAVVSGNQILFSHSDSIESVSLFSMNGKMLFDKVRLHGNALTANRLPKGVYTISIQDRLGHVSRNKIASF